MLSNVSNYHGYLHEKYLTWTETTSHSGLQVLLFSLSSGILFEYA